MPASFALKVAKNKQFYFNLLATNGEIILSSEQYTTKSNARKGIASVQKNAPLGERYDRRKARNGKPYFVLKAANHQVIGKSEMYSSDAAMEKGIKSVQKNAPKAKVREV